MNPYNIYLIHLVTFFVTLPILSNGIRIKSELKSLSPDDSLSYYTRENCQAMGYMPQWSAQGYSPVTHFEKLFKTPLAIDLIAAAHSSNETGFEQVTADWGCDYKSCYGTGPSGGGCESIGFYGPGAKDPAGGGCPHGPVRVYEDLTCALKLGLKTNPYAFGSFCDITNERLGMFECLAFFANVITETGAFAETEERDPRSYCWDRNEGSRECCPASDHQPCLGYSDAPIKSDEYPSPKEKWLGNSDYPGKCCSYHGRGFLQVSYEPNYKAMSKALLGDETILWHYPYKVDSDGVMGWTAALWFWFNQHPAQVGNKEGAAIENVSPRSQIYDWQSGKGLPGAINVINGAECSGVMETQKALSRVSYFHAIAHRMSAKPPLVAGEADINYYPLPGTSECEKYQFCKKQFHNAQSACPVFNQRVDCSRAPYIVNASTPMGFWRKTIKLTAIDGATPICQLGFRSGQTPDVWAKAQEPFTPINYWWEMLDIDRDNVCDYVKLMYPDPKTPGNFIEGDSQYCSTVCWKDFSWEVSNHGQPCEQPPKPCKTLAEYMSHPLPRKGWESGQMGDYKGGAFLGRVGPGLVMAMNGEFGLGDKYDRLCYHFGATACLWNTGMGCYATDKQNPHQCRVFPPKVPDAIALKTYQTKDGIVLAPNERPSDLLAVLQYFDSANCPTPTGRTVLEQLFPHGPDDMDLIFSVQYSQSDGFANARYDNDDPSVNQNTILKGFKGPDHVWKNMLCAFQLGVPSDPDYFQKHFGLRQSVTSSSGVPYPLSEDQRRFAQLEFIAMAANMIKETGAMGQAEEQDPRCYCNYQGGTANPCCPNDWGNSPACSTKTNSQNRIIPLEEFKRGLTPGATCCSYHGRGFLQTSYERNYGDLGAFMFQSYAHGIDENRGRRLMLNYPQTIDPFGITGWTTTFSFWLHGHPCQYCDGRNTSTLDWNAPLHSAHTAMVNYDKPGQGLGLTFTIINGQECESPQITETEISWMGGAMRLSLFYNLAYRLQVKAPGEFGILPLPGTIECDASPWCRGTFFESPTPVASYRLHSGGCWALTPQPVSSGFQAWPWCKARERIPGTSKYGAHLDTVSFSIKKQNGCEMLHDFSCGVKIINSANKASMFTHKDLRIYTEVHKITTDYEDINFQKSRGLGPNELCRFAVDTNPRNNYPPPGQNCEWWCRNPSGAGSCSAMDPATCRLSGTGLHFVQCANKFFKSMFVTQDCEIKLPDVFSTTTTTPTTTVDRTTLRTTTTTTTRAATTTRATTTATTTRRSAAGANGQHPVDWPCNLGGFCRCA